MPIYWFAPAWALSVMIDRDFVEESNFQRQTLFEESDAHESLPKAVAAERRLRAINAGVQVEGIVADLTPANAKDLFRGMTSFSMARIILKRASWSMTLPSN